MSHPTPHPGTPTPPPGPSRSLAAKLRAVRAAAAATAGTLGRSAAPLAAEQRADNYRRQNGTERLTARQWRRIVHKASHAAVRSA